MGFSDGTFLVRKNMSNVRWFAVHKGHFRDGFLFHIKSLLICQLVEVNYTHCETDKEIVYG